MEGKSTFVNDMKKAIKAVEDTFTEKQQTTMMNYFPVKHGKSNPKTWNKEMKEFGWLRVEKELAKRKKRNKSWKRFPEKKLRPKVSTWTDTTEIDPKNIGWGDEDTSWEGKKKTENDDNKYRMPWQPAMKYYVG